MRAAVSPAQTSRSPQDLDKPMGIGLAEWGVHVQMSVRSHKVAISMPSLVSAFDAACMNSELKVLAIAGETC